MSIKNVSTDTRVSKSSKFLSLNAFTRLFFHINLFFVVLFNVLSRNAVVFVNTLTAAFLISSPSLKLRFNDAGAGAGGDAAGAGAGQAGDSGQQGFNPETVDKTYKINNEELKFSDVFTKAKDKYKFDESKMTNEEIISVVNDFAFVANKQVANELFNRSKAEYDNKFQELEKQKAEYNQKMIQAAELIENIERSGKSKIEEIDTKLKADGLSVSEQVQLENAKIKIQNDIENAKSKKSTEEFINNATLKSIEIEKARLTVENQLAAIYAEYPQVKPTEDFGVIYKKLTQPGAVVSEDDQQKFIALYDAINTYTNANIPAVNTFKVKWAKNFKSSEGAGDKNGEDVSLTLKSLIEKGLLNTDLNTALEQLKKSGPVTPGGQTNHQGFVSKTREQRLAEAKF